MEEFKVSGEKLKERLKELIREGNVRRVILKNPAGRVLLDMPLNAGVVGVRSPSGLRWRDRRTTEYTVSVERDPQSGAKALESAPTFEVRLAVAAPVRSRAPHVARCECRRAGSPKAQQVRHRPCLTTPIESARSSHAPAARGH
jgi:hypothetical protein